MSIIACIQNIPETDLKINPKVRHNKSILELKKSKLTI